MGSAPWSAKTGEGKPPPQYVDKKTHLELTPVCVNYEKKGWWVGKKPTIMAFFHLRTQHVKSHFVVHSTEIKMSNKVTDKNSLNVSVLNDQRYLETKIYTKLHVSHKSVPFS